MTRILHPERGRLHFLFLYTASLGATNGKISRRRQRDLHISSHPPTSSNSSPPLSRPKSPPTNTPSISKTRRGRPCIFRRQRKAVRTPKTKLETFWACDALSFEIECRIHPRPAYDSFGRARKPPFDKYGAEHFRQAWTSIRSSRAHFRRVRLSPLQLGVGVSVCGYRLADTLLDASIRSAAELQLSQAAEADFVSLDHPYLAISPTPKAY